MTSATINDILLAVQTLRGVGAREIRGPSRDERVREARLLFYFCSSQCFAKPTVWIAKAVNRSSATVGEAILRMKKQNRVSARAGGCGGRRSRTDSQSASDTDCDGDALAMAWTGPQEDLLRELARQRLSGSQIAERLGKTRSAVCGKAWRFGLCLGGMPADGGVTVVRIRRKRKNAARKARAQKPKPFVLFHQMGLVDINAPKRVREDGFIPQVFPPAPEHQRKTVETLEEHHCRFPIGDPQHPDFHFCGAEKVSGLPYCSEHSAVAYQPARVRAPIHHSTPVPAFETEDA